MIVIEFMIGLIVTALVLLIFFGTLIYAVVSIGVLGFILFVCGIGLIFFLIENSGFFIDLGKCLLDTTIRRWF